MILDIRGHTAVAGGIGTRQDGQRECCWLVYVQSEFLGLTHGQSNAWVDRSTITSYPALSARIEQAVRLDALSTQLGRPLYKNHLPPERPTQRHQPLIQYPSAEKRRIGREGI